MERGEVRRNEKKVDICSYNPDSIASINARVRDFLLPGIIHFIKGVFTKYQLAVELFTFTTGKETSHSLIKNTIDDTVDLYGKEIEPFVALMNSLYTPPKVLVERFPWDIPLYAGCNADSTSYICTELLRTSVEEMGNSLKVAPSVLLLPRELCFRLFAPVAESMSNLSCLTVGSVLYLRQQEEHEASEIWNTQKWRPHSPGLPIPGLPIPGLVIETEGLEEEEVMRKMFKDSPIADNALVSNKRNESVECSMYMREGKLSIVISIINR